MWKEGVRECNDAASCGKPGNVPNALWKSLVNKGCCTSVQVERGGFNRAPLGGMGNLTAIQNPAKPIGKAWFSQARCAECQEHTEGSPCEELGRCTRRKGQPCHAPL